MSKQTAKEQRLGDVVMLIIYTAMFTWFVLTITSQPYRGPLWAYLLLGLLTAMVALLGIARADRLIKGK